MGREYIFHGVQVRATTLYPIVMEQQSGLPHVRNLVASDNPDIMIIIEDFLTLYTTKKKREGIMCGFPLDCFKLILNRKFNFVICLTTFQNIFTRFFTACTFTR